MSTPSPDSRPPENSAGRPAWGRRIVQNWQAFLPALGLCLTLVLLLIVGRCLLSGLDMTPTDFDKLQVRVPVETKGGDGKRPGPPEFKPLGKMQDVKKQLTDPCPDPAPAPAETLRCQYLDVRGRVVAFLTTWAVFNLIQGALAVAVLALAVRALWLYSRGQWGFLAGPGAVLFLCVTAAAVLYFTGYLPLSPEDRVDGQLQTAIREALGRENRIGGLTKLGDLSIISVVFLAPLVLCLLLYRDAPITPADRVYWFHLLMYGTALLLVVGVIQVAYQNRLPALFFDDEFNRQRVGEMASATGLLVGGVFSVALGLVFLPAGFLLHDSAVVPPAAPAGASRQWVTELLAVLAPVLTALPVGRLFELAG